MLSSLSPHKGPNFLDFYSFNMNIHNLLQKLSCPIPRYWDMFEKAMAGRKEGWDAWGQGCWRGMMIKMVEGLKSMQGGGNRRRYDFVIAKWKLIFGISEERLKAQHKNVRIKMWRHILNVRRREEFKGNEKGENKEELEHWSTWSRGHEGEETV